MRSPVQSWVPLQESTAETLCFFRLYTPLKPTPRQGLTLTGVTRELALKGAHDNGTRERSERWLEGKNRNTKPYCVSLDLEKIANAVCTQLNNAERAAR